jgi:hypothetical protein
MKSANIFVALTVWLIVSIARADELDDAMEDTMRQFNSELVAWRCNNVKMEA